MKKYIIISIIFVFLFDFTGCSNKTLNSQNSNSSNEFNEKLENLAKDKNNNQTNMEFVLNGTIESILKDLGWYVGEFNIYNQKLFFLPNNESRI